MKRGKILITWKEVGNVVLYEEGRVSHYLELIEVCLRLAFGLM